MYHILLKQSKMDIIAAVFVIIVGIFYFIWQFDRISKYKAKKRRISKCINAVITKRERIEIRTRSWKHVYRYLYTFTGLDEYEGVTFCDETLLLECVHVEGEKVSLHINPDNPEEFWFEEADEPGQWILVCSVIMVVCALDIMKLTIERWERLRSGIETRFEILLFVICNIILLIACVRTTIKASRQKNLKMRMTKRINVVISDRWAPSLYGDTISYKYRYTFKGRDEYEGVTFDDMSLKVKKKYEIGETVSLLINTDNLKEFWFEEADEAKELAVRLWLVFAASLFLFLLAFCLIFINIWDEIPW